MTSIFTSRAFDWWFEILMRIGSSGKKEPEKEPDPPEPPEDPDLERKLSALEEHVSHRATGLLEQGFTLDQVLVLMFIPDVVHDADGLLKKGCSVDTAFDILAP